MAGVALSACLFLGVSGASAQSLDEEGRAALSDAVDLLSELELATGDGMAPGSAGSAEADGASGAGQDVGDAADLVRQGPGVLRRLYQHRIDVPPLARLALSGEAMIDLDADHAAQALPIMFATAADQLEEIAGEEGDGDSFGPGGLGLSLPIGALAGVVVAVTVPVVAMSWYRRRAERMEALSFVDPLTGLANRRRLDQDLARLDAERTAARLPVSVAMVDVDEFKRFNDTFGHREGDVALQSVSSTIAAAVRSSDSVYRYGGEEFLVLLRNAPQSEAVEVCEGIRLAVASLPNHVTVSIGVATGNDEPLPTLTVAADEALYRAKEDGRNRIVATSVINRGGARVSSV